MLDDVQLYIFGSATKSVEILNDIDVLVIYQSYCSLVSFKEIIGTIHHKFPIDVLYMNAEEERELNFIKEQNAISPHKVWLQTSI